MFIKNLHIKNRFFLLIAIVVVLFLISYVIPVVFIVAQVFLGLTFALVIVETMLLSGKKTVNAHRVVQEKLSLGDENKVSISFLNPYPFRVNMEIMDEAPYQFQLRNLKFYKSLGAKEKGQVSYSIRPVKRGAYTFNDIRLFISTPIDLFERRFIIPSEKEVAVYPSILQMKKAEFNVFSKLTLSQGIKKIRRLGHNNEFEQIKNYVQGDDYKTINWKATSRRHELMVNQYQDEKAQQVYCIVDKSRAMRMPFRDMTLLDYAINCTLAFSNVALRKSDRAGLITFSDKLGAALVAERNAMQLTKINEQLYKQRTGFKEANFELLYTGVRRYVKGRSMLLLYTNFDTLSALKRVLPTLRRINKQHLLVVVFFQNTELSDILEQDVKTVNDIYFSTIAQQFVIEKEKMVHELRKYGIQAVLSRPETLTVDSINKYLELKSRGMI